MSREEKNILMWIQGQLEHTDFYAREKKTLKCQKQNAQIVAISIGILWEMPGPEPGLSNKKYGYINAQNLSSGKYLLQEEYLRY